MDPLASEPKKSTPENSTPAGGFSPKMDYSKFILPGAIAGGAIVLGLCIVAAALIFKSPGNSTPAGQNPVASVNIKDVSTANEPYIGNPNAPVTLAYWSDYQCPFCKQFEQGTLRQLVSDYVNTGKVKIIFKDFEFLDSRLPTSSPHDSQIAGEYARAVWELYPAQYFNWRTAMYNAQDDENSGFGDLPSVITLTKTIPGLDATKITALYTSKQAEYAQDLANDMTEGAKFGIQGTPAFIVGTQAFLQGAPTYATLSQYIDSLLSK